MRNSCNDCVRKHLAQASVLLDEAHLGYPHHRWLAAGHLAEAESEAIGQFPDLATKIRAQRLLVMRSHEDSKLACIENLIIEACFAAGEDDLVKHQTPGSSKVFAAVIAHEDQPLEDEYEQEVNAYLDGIDPEQLTEKIRAGLNGK